MEEKLRVGLEDRDIFWQEKMAEQERSHSEMLENLVILILIMIRLMRYVCMHAFMSVCLCICACIFIHKLSKNRYTI